MISRISIYKLLAILPITAFRKINLLLPRQAYGAELSVAELFLQNVFSGSPSRTHANIVIVMFGLFEVVIFNILFGSLFYRDFFDNSIYIFVRQKSRLRWYINRLWQLTLFSMIYNTIFIGITFVLSARYSKFGIDKEALYMFLLAFVMVFLFSLWTTILINLISIKTGSVLSFITNYIALTVCSFLAIFHEKVPIVRNIPILLALNPVANVTINWGDGIGKGLLPSVYFIIIILITTILGYMVISRTDISLENKENS